jgi:hypothetical protein
MDDPLPSRTSLNRYGLFVSQVHKLTKDREMCKCDSETRRKASLIAAMSSNHSWKTFEYLSEGRSLDKEAVSEETKFALDKGWMNITERDVEEVMTLNIDEYAFSMWLFYTVNKDDRQKYKVLYTELKKEFSMGLEPIENRADY